MKLKTIVLMLSLFLIFFVVSACSSNDETSTENTENTSGNVNDSNDASQSEDSDSQSGGTLKVGISADPTTLDPYVYSTTIDRQVFRQIFNNLYRYNLDSLMPENVLIESEEVSDDGKTFTMYLREGITFHNGKEMEAEDIKFSIEQAMRPEASRSASLLSGITAINIVDPLTVELKLENRDNILIHSLVDVYVTPNDDSIDHSLTPVGTGPFKFIEWRRNEQIVLEKNEDYWEDGYPKLDGVVFKTVPDSSVMALQLQSEQLDLIHPVGTSQAQQVMENPSTKMQEVNKESNTSSHLMVINNSKAPFDNKKFRQAVNYALDREKMEQSLFGTFVVRSSSIPESHTKYNSDAPIYRKDIDKAKQLLEESGYNGEEVELMYHNINMTYDIVAKIADQSLKDAGINVKLRGIEIAQWVENVFDKKEFDLALTGIIPKPEPVDLLNHPYGKINGESIQWANTAWYDKVTEVKTSSPEKADKLLDELQYEVLDESPAIIVGGMISGVGMSNDVQDFKGHPQTFLNLERVWLDR